MPMSWRKFDANPGTATRSTRRQPVRWIGSLNGRDLFSAHYIKSRRSWVLVDLRSLTSLPAMALWEAKVSAEAILTERIKRGAARF